MSTEPFFRVEGFCPDCGCILPVLASKGDIECYACTHTFDPKILGSMESTYTVYFNSRKTKAAGVDKKKKEKRRSQNADGPIVERKCIKCGCEKMTYSTLQLRSADEGQTVFYTCINCHHKETENS